MASALALDALWAALGWTPSAVQLEQLQALIQADSFDEAAVRSLLQAQQKDKLEHEVARAKLQFDINKVLTVEQKAKLAERQQKWQEKAKARAEAKS